MSGFQSPEEFDAWKLSWELKEGVVAFTATNLAARDCKFCDEIRESARSAPDNIAEGYYRFNPPDFANFVRIARVRLVKSEISFGMRIRASIYPMTNLASSLGPAAAQSARVPASVFIC